MIYGSYFFFEKYQNGSVAYGRALTVAVIFMPD